MEHLADIARDTVARRGLLPAGAPVLLMLSGGGDSVALLHLLASGALGERPVKALHVNHQLRGAESDSDEEFAVALSATLGVECAVVRYDVSAFADQAGLNLEDAGRTVRYRFADSELDAWCAVSGWSADGARIATAHTLDDRVETFFMRAVAGAGTGALSSIAAARGRIVRPLLDCERADVRRALSAAGLTWREDASNTDDTRARVLVRTELLPLVERLNPQVRATLARTMDLIAADEAILSRVAGERLAECAVVADGEVRFDRARTAELERPLARRVVRAAVLAAFPEASRMTYEHLDALAAGMADDAFARDLPFGLRAEAEYGTIRVSRRGESVVPVAPGLLELPGTLDLGTAGTIGARPLPDLTVAPGPDVVSVDADTVRWPLVVDSVRPGDRMRPLGLGGSKKLSDLLVDAKVPRRLRSGTPVVRDGDWIVWLAGVALADECRVTPASERAVELRWERPDAGGTDVL